MRLPCDKVSLSHLSVKDLKKAILERRAVIRGHRDAKGDDRCWLDDWLVWAMLDDTPDPPITPPLHEDAIEQCTRFWYFRNERFADPIPPDAIIDPLRWDDDLAATNGIGFIEELMRIQEAIEQHRDIAGRIRTSEDDRLLYAVLPEKLPADFRLPPREDFLGEAKAPHAGCPAFWRSHAHCPTTRHDLHRWGPCVTDAPAEEP